MDYFTSLSLLTVAGMIVMLICLRRTINITEVSRRGFVFSFSLILAISLAGLLSYYISGKNGNALRTVHGLLTATEMSLSPIVVIAFSSLTKDRKKLRMSWYVIAANAIMEFLSLQYGFIFTIDSENEFHPGKYYAVYIAVCAYVVIVLFREVMRVNRKFQGRNRETLLAIMAMIVLEFGIQLLSPNLKAEWLGFSFAGLLYYIYFTDAALVVDPVTGLLSRKCYDSFIRQVNYVAAAVYFDIDDMGELNEDFGRTFGDQMMKEIAGCIREIYGPYGYCFRIKDDEFVVIFRKNRLGEFESVDNDEEDEDYAKIERSPLLLKLKNDFFDALRKMRQSEENLPDVSAGYAVYCMDDPMEYVVEKACHLARREYKDK